MSSNDSVLEVSDTEDNLIFCASEWIGTEKIYPSTAPQFIRNARATVLALPEEFRVLIPKAALPVTRLIALHIPEISNEIISVKATAWFSNDIPGSNVTAILQTRPIPNREHLRSLEAAFGQAWFNGSKSIIDSRYNDGRDRLPLWSLTLWEIMSEIHMQQAKWKRSYLWLEEQRKRYEDNEATTNAIEKAVTILSIMGWKTTVSYQNATARTDILFPQLLSWDWVNDELINSMMERLSSRLKKSDIGDKKKIMIASLPFANKIMAWQTLKKSGPYTKKNGAGVLVLYEKHVKKNGIKRLYLPVHINGNHWIAAYIDFEKEKMAYGEKLQIINENEY